MHDGKMFIAAVVGLLAAASATSTVAADVVTGPAGMEVAGIRLGASPQQVKDALRRAGYRVTYTTEAESFGQRVAREVANRKGRPTSGTAHAGTGSIVATGPHQERADVRFAQTPVGSSVARIEVTIPATVMSDAAFREQLVARYGKPDAVREQGLASHWCSAEAARICGATYTGGEIDTAWPKLSASTAYATNTVTLQAGTRAESRLSQDFETEVLRQVPRTDSAAF